MTCNFSLEDLVPHSPQGLHGDLSAGRLFSRLHCLKPILHLQNTLEEKDEHEHLPAAYGNMGRGQGL